MSFLEISCDLNCYALYFLVENDFEIDFSIFLPPQNTFDNISDQVTRAAITASTTENILTSPEYVLF